MTLLEVEELQLAALPPGLLWGRNIETPRVGEARPGRQLAIGGWVLGRSSPAVAVEVLHEGQVIRRAPLGAARPDLAAAFPQVPEAVRGGFRTSVSLLPGAATIELQLQAVLQDQRRVPLGLLRLRRPPLAAAHGGELPLVSVVIPCYNQAHFLPEAIESVLAQSYPHLELVVVDDGSSDNTAAVAARYPGVRCVQQPNQGLAGARNSGLRHSSGGYLVFLDADDRLLPHTLQTGLDALLARPECAFVSGHSRWITSNGSPLPIEQPVCTEHDRYRALLRGEWVWLCATVMYRRAILEEVGGFDPTLPACEDYDLYFRITRRFSAYCHDQLVMEYRRHSANMTDNAALMLKYTLTVLRAQWDYVKGKEQYEKDYRAGIKFWRKMFGNVLVDDVLINIRKRKWIEAVRGIVVLCQHYPAGLISILSPITSQLSAPASQQAFYDCQMHWRKVIDQFTIPFGSGRFGPRLDRPPVAACTIIARNYLSYAMTLAQSFLRHEPDGHFYLLVVDGIPQEIQLNADVVVVHPDELGLPHFMELCFKYNIIELCTAVKPAFLSLLLDHYNENAIIYLDPDTLIMRPLDELKELLALSSIVLTPHSLTPIEIDGRKPNEQDFLLTGVFNLGCIGVRQSHETKEFLRWWDDHLRDGCRDDKPNGLFVDQKWVDLVPVFFPSTAILRDDTYNVAYWNLHSRVIERSGEIFLVNGRPLAFFHFSGFDPANDQELSKNQNRIEVMKKAALGELLRIYAELHQKNGYAECKHWQYPYAKFDNGIEIDPLLGRMYANTSEETRKLFGNVFRAEGDNSFFSWATRPQPETGRISRYLMLIYHSRPDIITAFPDIYGRDRAAFLQWARTYGAQEMGYDQRLVHE